MTEDQLALLEIHEIVLPPRVEGQTIDQRFWAFDSLNPWVYEAFERMTRRYVSRGAQRVSVKMLTEVLRYEYGSTRGPEQWKLNNSFTSLYARKLVHDHPEWDGLIELRRLRSVA